MHIQFIKGKFTSLIESKRLELKKLANLYPILHARKFMINFSTFHQYRTLNVEQIIISIKKFKFYKINNNLLKIHLHILYGLPFKLTSFLIKIFILMTLNDLMFV